MAAAPAAGGRAPYTPPRALSRSEPPLLSLVRRDGSRGADARRRSPVARVQTFVMRNKHSVRAGYTGESAVFWAGEAGPAAAERADVVGDAMAGAEVFDLRFVRDGSIRGYVIVDLVGGRDLLKVHFHGDTNSPFDRAFKAFLRSPNIKWDVENMSLFSDIPSGTKLGLIREVYPDNRVFEPRASVLPGVPRLEMQTAESFGRRYYLAVTDVPEPVGEVVTSLLGRVAARSEQYVLALRNCTREEAVLWLAMVVATDMKRRKSVNSKGLRSFGAFA